MPVSFLSEAHQETAINQYNQSKSRGEKIPLVPRNANSGWPLLQVSLFSPLATDSRKYGAALGGGKCHYFHIGAFNLACLLAQIPGKVQITGNGDVQKERQHLKADNVGLFLSDFTMEHQSLGVKISSTTGVYGKRLSVECPDQSTQTLRLALEESFSFSQSPGAKLEYFSAWGEEPVYTSEQIKTRINQEVAVFSGGQIFVDLGELLNKDPEIKAFFKDAFKVDEFLRLQENTAELQAKESETDEAPLEEQAEILPSLLDNVPHEQKIFSKIEIRENPGNSLGSDPIHSEPKPSPGNSSFLLNALIVTASAGAIGLCIAAIATAFVVASIPLSTALIAGGLVLGAAAAGTFFYHRSKQNSEERLLNELDLSFH